MRAVSSRSGTATTTCSSSSACDKRKTKCPSGNLTTGTNSRVRAENLNPDVLVMQRANQGVRHDVFRFAEPGAKPAHPGPRTDDPTQMHLAQHDDVVHTTIVSINRSAKEFCRGEPTAMGLSRMPMARNRRVTPTP
jgi:hypothetical protein